MIWFSKGWEDGDPTLRNILKYYEVKNPNLTSRSRKITISGWIIIVNMGSREHMFR